MLIGKALVASLLATAALAAPAPRGERRVPLKPSSQDKLDAMKRWQSHVEKRAAEQASKYVSWQPWRWVPSVAAPDHSSFLLLFHQPVDHIGNVSDYSLFDQFQDTGALPEPIRGKTGTKLSGPTNHELDRQNPDTFVPPNTDSGTVPQAKWPFSLSHNRLQNGGWTRQQNQQVLPIATEMAGVQMHLDQYAVRELHWHATGEWSYVLNGTLRVAILDADGRNYLDDVSQGDLWAFPSGLPHSIECLTEGGCEFLLVFDDGSFSEDDTFGLSDFVAHIPREVINKNFPGFNNSDFDNFPDDSLYIFPTAEDPQSFGEEYVEDPQGHTSVNYTYKASQVDATPLPGGSVKIIDSRNFSVSDIALAEVKINPGGLREMHWHPTSDEWSYFISGHARITVWAGTDNARTFDFQAGDVAYIPVSQGHYIEALGSEPVHYLELFKTPVYSDVSLSNWLSLMPPNVVKSHLGWSDAQIKKLQRFKSHSNQVVQGNNDGSGRRLKRDVGLYGGREMWA